MIKIDNMNRKVSRILAFGFGVIALVTLSLLAISLNGLRFDPGLPLPLEFLLPNIGANSDTSQIMQVLMPVVRVMLIFTWILLPFSVVYLILSKRARKQLLKDLAFITPMIFVLYVLAKIFMNANNGSNPANRLGLSAAEAFQALHLPQYTPPPSWVTTAAVSLIALFFAFIIFEIFVVIWRERRMRSQNALAVMRYEIQSTLTAIESGDDLHNAITLCYLKMVDAIRQYRQLSRDQDMTPQEFELYLEHYGLPHEPVHRLTRLFERVRYGAAQPDPADEREALESLSLIITACQQPLVGSQD